MPKNFIADTVSTKVGLHHSMLFIDGKNAALEILDLKFAIFVPLKNSVSRGS